MNKVDSIILHTHELFITLYILVFTIKLVLLILNRETALANFRKKTKVVGEMVLPTLFLVSGIYLTIITNTWGNTWFLIKLSLIIISIFTGIITFRTNSRILGLLTFLIF